MNHQIDDFINYIITKKYINYSKLIAYGYVSQSLPH